MNEPIEAAKRPDAGRKWDLTYTSSEQHSEVTEKSIERKFSIKQLLMERFAYPQSLHQNDQLKIARKGHDHLECTTETLDGSVFLDE